MKMRVSDCRCWIVGGLAVLLLAACDWPLEVPDRVEQVSPADGASVSVVPIVFSWQRVEDAAAYRLQLSANTGFTELVADSSVSGTTAGLTVITDGSYYWRVRAMSADSVWGPWSDLRRVTLRRFSIAATLPLTGYPHDIAVQSGRAFVAAGQAGLAVVDLANPETPTLLGMFMDSLNEAWGVAVRDSCAYLAYGYTELVVVDVRRPDSLGALGELGYLQPGYGYDIAVDDTLVYVAAGAQFARISVADPRFPGLSFQYSYPRNCRAVVVDGSRGFVACEQLGVAGWRLDVSPPAQVGVMDTPSNARGLALDGSRLYVADGRGGLIVAEAADPAVITPLGGIKLRGYAQAVAVQDTLAFVACGTGGFAVVNVARPEQPELSAVLATPYAAAVTVEGRHVFGCDRDLGLVVIRME